MTTSGGSHDKGTIFTFNINTNTLTKLFSFNGANGQSPRGKLLKYEDQIVYGLAGYGGQGSSGTLFRYDLSLDLFEVKHHFNGYDGRAPDASLIKASNGKLYGTTEYGGGNGSIFEFDPISNNFTNLINLSRPTTGYRPLGNLIELYDNKLYGLVAQGGVNDHGVLFYYDIEEYEYHKQIDFESNITGRAPFGSLVKTSDNRVFGLTMMGGSFRGTIFEYFPDSNQLNIKVRFHDAPNGCFPDSNLEKVNDSIFVGITTLGGIRFKDGLIYSYNVKSSELINLYHFNGYESGGAPFNNFALSDDGKIYGCTSNWSAGNSYTPVIFEFDINTKIYRVLYEFDEHSFATSVNSIALFDENTLYGTTSQHGEYGGGVIFKFDLNQMIVTKVFDFNGVSDGKWPKGGLIKASDNKLYGVTYGAGNNSDGVIFSFDPSNNNFEVVFNFNSNETGNTQLGELFETENGILYGLNRTGGMYDKGVFYRFDVNSNTFEKIVDFDGVNYGSYPEGEVMKGSNGKLYGMTRNGGEYDKGVLFEYDIENDIFSEKLDFNGDNGGLPRGHLIEMGECISDSISPNSNELPIVYSDCLVEDIISPIATNSCGDLIEGQTETEFPITTQDTTEIVWYFEDNFGNTLEQLQLVVIKDTILPEISLPDNTELMVNGECQVVVFDFISILDASDNCGIETISQTPSAGTVIDGNTNQFVNVEFEAKDINGNSTVLSVEIPIIDEKEVQILDVDKSNVSCFGFDDGMFSVQVSDPLEELYFSIDNNNYTNTSGQFENIIPGDYYISVQNSNSCIYYFENNPVSINEAHAIEFSSVILEDESCDGDLGSIIIDAYGGTGDLHYSINNGDDYQTTGAFYNLIANTYVVRLKDENSCTQYYPENPMVIKDLNPSNVIINPDPHGIICINSELILKANAFEAISYDWDNGDTGSQISRTESVSGVYNYTCTVINIDGCESSESIEIIWDECLGEIDLINQENEIRVYPNPADNFITIELLGANKSGFVELFDIFGRKILQSSLYGQKDIDISKLCKGVYFVKVYSNGNEFSFKIMKE